MSAKSRLAKIAATAVMAGLVGGTGILAMGCQASTPNSSCNACKGANGCKGAASCKAATPATQPAGK